MTVTSRHFTSRLLALALVLVASLGADRGARASGLLVARFGGEWGHPMSDDLWAIYYNPAGLSLLGGTKITLSGTLAWRSLTYTRDPGAIDQILDDPAVGSGTPKGDGVLANSGKASLSNFLQTPFFAVGSDFGVKGLGIAAGLYVPFGGQSVWDEGTPREGYPGSSDGTQRWWVIEGSARSIYATAAAGYRVEALRLSFGLGFNLAFTSIDNVQARNVDGTDSLVSNGRLQEGRARTKVSSIDPALSLGLLWEPVDHLFIAASYQSQPNFGEQRLTGTVDMILGSGPAPDNTRTQAEMKQALPDVVRFGVRYGEPKSWEVRAFGDWAHWSVLKEQCVLNATIAGRTCEGDALGKMIIIPRNWKNAFGLRGGASWWPTNGLELVLGGGWDGTSVPDAMVEPAFYDGEKVHMTLGAKLKVAEDKVELMLQFTQFFYPDRGIAPRAHVPRDPADPNGATWTDIESIGLRSAVRVPNAAGLYHHTISVVELGASYRF